MSCTDVNLVLNERTHKMKIKYSMHQYSNSYAYFRQLAHYLQTRTMTAAAMMQTKVTALTMYNHIGVESNGSSTHDTIVIVNPSETSDATLGYRRSQRGALGAVASEGI